MGKPSTTGVEQANQVLSGSFTAVGPSASIAMYGAFNFALLSTTNTALTTTNASAAATVASATGLVAGQGINSVNVPAGTTIGAISGTNVTLAFPTGHTNAEVVTGTDNAALFDGSSFSGSLQLERSFDGGASWIVCGIGGDGTEAIYNAGTPVSVVVSEPERGVLYRVNCTSYSSGTIAYRLSTSSPAAMAWGIMS